ncbi:MAG: hypothetical protein IT372_02450 [Polyangiaceae bacterium]|nr:hypothetical protein [Polyangiaceae bacterium]
MKLGFTWMTAAVGALFLGGWGSTPVIQEPASTPAPASARLDARSDRAACAPEVLRWQYDEATRVLRLDDGRVRLNCCGQRTMTVERVDSMLEVTQRDEPDAGGRCATECAFDLTVSVPNVAARDTYVKLLRDVTDEGGSPTLQWEGHIDLSRPSGEITLDCADARQ